MEHSGGLGEKKYCSPAHIGLIAYYCTEDEMYVCEKCATSTHLEHFNKLKGIMSIIHKKLPKYLNLKEKARLLSKTCLSFEEVSELVKSQLGAEYDKFIADIIKYKETFIERGFREIFTDKEIVAFSDPKGELREVLERVNVVYSKIKECVEGKKVEMREIMRVEEAVELNNMMDSLANLSSEFKQMGSKIKYKFDEEAVKRMFEIQPVERVCVGKEIIDSQYVTQIADTRGIMRVFDIKVGVARDITLNINGFPQYSATCVINETIYIGGYNSSGEKSRYFFSLNASSNSLRELGRMIDGRYNFCLVPTSDNEIYAIGGFDVSKKHGSNYLKECEKYKVKENRWTSISPLSLGRSVHAACFFYPTKEIYVFGGYDVTGSATDSIEKLLLGRDIWKNVNLKLRGGWTNIRDIMSFQVSKTQILIFGDSNFIFNVKEESMTSKKKPFMHRELRNYKVSTVKYLEYLYCFNDGNKHEILRYSLQDSAWRVIEC